MLHRAAAPFFLLYRAADCVVPCNSTWASSPPSVFPEQTISLGAIEVRAPVWCWLCRVWCGGVVSMLGQAYSCEPHPSLKGCPGTWSCGTCGPLPPPPPPLQIHPQELPTLSRRKRARTGSPSATSKSSSTLALWCVWCRPYHACCGLLLLLRFLPPPPTPHSHPALPPT